MSEIDAIGDVVTGGMLSRAVEPNADSVGSDGHTHEANCLNCSAPLQGEFCHACGQRAHVHRTLSAFFHDLLHGVLHFEGKTWRTLPMLAWNPGELTKRYIGGQRASFVSPIAMFLFSVFLMFAVISLLGGVANTNVVKVEPSEEARAEIDAALADASDDVRSATKDRNEAAQENAGSLSSRLDSPTPGWFDQAYQHAKKNPKLLLYKVQTNAYKWSWALIPISVPFVWLLFLHRQRYRAYRAYDHTVFVTYSLAFVSILTIAASLAMKAGLSLIMMVLVLYVPFHMFRQLKGAYALSTISALWRTLALTLFSWVALAIFAFAILAMGISS